MDSEDCEGAVGKTLEGPLGTDLEPVHGQCPDLILSSARNEPINPGIDAEGDHFTRDQKKLLKIVADFSSFSGRNQSRALSTFDRSVVSPHGEH